MSDDIKKLIRIRGWVSLGTRYSEFFWWDDKTDTLWGDYDNVWRLDWDRLQITEKELPQDCLETLQRARQWIADGHRIPEYDVEGNRVL